MLSLTKTNIFRPRFVTRITKRYATNNSKESQKKNPAIPSPLLVAPLSVSGSIAGVLAGFLNGKEARARNMSPVGAAIMAGIGGAGGGTIKSCLSGEPAGWIRDPSYLYICLAAGAAGYLGLGKTLSESAGGQRFMNTIFGLSTPGCALVGGAVAESTNYLTGAFFGVLTVAGGGIIKDVLLGKKPSVFYYNSFSQTLPVVLGSIVYAWSGKRVKSINARWLLTIATTFLTGHAINKKKELYDLCKKYNII